MEREEKMNADIKWLDDPEVFRVNQVEAHSDHVYYRNYAELEKKENGLTKSLNGQWDFCFSRKCLLFQQTKHQPHIKEYWYQGIFVGCNDTIQLMRGNYRRRDQSIWQEEIRG